MTAAEPDRSRASPKERTSMDRALGDFSDDARRAEASRARRQRSDDAVVNQLSGTFLGTLLALVESSQPALVLTRNGSNHRGVVVAVGPDVAVLDWAADERRTLLAHDAIEAIRSTASIASREVEALDTGPRMAELLDSFGVADSRMVLTTGGGNRLMGRIVSVGHDQVTLRLDGENELVIVAIAAIDEAVIEP